MGTNKLRRTQGRPQREEQKTRQIRHLKGENQRLQRRLARANRKIEKMAGAIDSLGPVPDPEPTKLAGDEMDRKLEEIADALSTMADSLKASLEPVNDSGPACPECGGREFSVVPFGPKTITLCRECKWRTTSQFLPPK